MPNESSVTGYLDEVNAALTALTETLETDPGDAELLDAVCAQAVRAIPGADLASVTAIHTGSPRTAASTDDRAVEIDRAQYALRDGPCLEAALAARSSGSRCRPQTGNGPISPPRRGKTPGETLPFAGKWPSRPYEPDTSTLCRELVFRWAPHT
ncbi:hypothetical protein GCM10027598_85210 [Amycolatopsis oliviviridis]|uniref:Uncharacterized protein n=1 Tax=Amycolatopsis oliviviridis TaxID=1471590 RepID=A0ABQ3MDV4_9PSEU|nr:hypothetical protein [Amycolatopsis oliviviridis]GHH38928.1 hypothetical protein GCM10017790_85310 [Amycolatopsis oliviviridis]